MESDSVVSSGVDIEPYLQVSRLQRAREAIDACPSDWESLAEMGRMLSRVREIANWSIGYLLLRVTKHYEPPGTDVLRRTEMMSLSSVTKMCGEIGVSRSHGYQCLRVVLNIPPEWSEHHLPWGMMALASAYGSRAVEVLELAEKGNLSVRQVAELLQTEEGEEEEGGIRQVREAYLRNWLAAHVNRRNAWVFWKLFSERLDSLGMLEELFQNGVGEGEKGVAGGEEVSDQGQEGGASGGPSPL